MSPDSYSDLEMLWLMQSVKATAEQGDDHPRRLLSGDRKFVTFVNPYSYARLRDREDLRRCFTDVFIDGISMAVLLSRIFGHRVPRVSFDMTSLAPDIFQASETQGLVVAIIGSEAGSLENCIRNVRGRWPRLGIGYRRHGFFGSAEERENCIRQVARDRPDVVILGMGTPLQEEFGRDIFSSVDSARLVVTCGGFLTQAGTSLQYYPRWVDALHLRWAYRMLSEPHTRKRTMKSYMGGLRLVAKDARLLSRPGNR